MAFSTAFIESTSTDCCLRLTSHPALLGYEAVHRRPSLMDFMHYLNICHMSNLLVLLPIPWVCRYVLSEAWMLCSCSSRLAAGLTQHTLVRFLRMWSSVCIAGFRNQRYPRRGALKCLGFLLKKTLLSTEQMNIYV